MHFNIEQDIDIGVIDADLEMFYPRIKAQYKIDHYLKSDDTGKLLNLCYHDAQNNVYIDVYKWVRMKGMYWHTYDVFNDAQDGIPSKYVFKGMPKEVFDIDAKAIKAFRQDTRYGRIMTNHGTWNRPLPEMPEEDICMACPVNYGYFKDVAYPDHVTTRKNFGVSEAKATFETKTCKGLC
ncbi:MAG: hypothetical protein GY861_07975 [bacterium]|nr:hypothetical protein [bacterium]